METARPRLSFWARNTPLWLIGTFTLLFGSLLLQFYTSDLAAEAGVRYYARGTYAQAEGHLRQAVNINPQNAEAAYYLGLCLLRDGRKAEALSWFRVALSVGHGVPRVAFHDEDLAQKAQMRIDRLGQ